MNNRLLYIVPLMKLSETASLGVRRKILGQAKAFEALGMDTTIIDASVPTRPYPYWVHHEFPVAIKILRFPFKRAYQFFHAVFFKRRSFAAMLEEVSTQGTAHIYLRHAFLSPQVLLFYARLRRLPNMGRIYLEVPTWPYLREPQARAYEYLLRPYVKRYVDRVVTFTDEERIFGVPTICITNGIDTMSIPTTKRQPQAGAPIQLTIAATLNSWVGLDRLLNGLAQYRSDLQEGTSVRVVVAGTGRYLEKWRGLAKRQGLLDIVEFAGAQDVAGLNSIFEKTDLALGNLANHRRRLTSNADLKHREYCARGVPFVISGRDPGFPDDFPFIFQVQLSDSPLEIEDLVQFLKGIQKNHPDYSQQLREYATGSLDWKIVLAIVSDSFKR